MNAMGRACFIGETPPNATRGPTGVFSYSFRTFRTRGAVMPAINVVSVREKLAPQREPYWLRIKQGRYIGYRKMVRGSPGTWNARFYDGERQHYQPLGDFADLPEKDRFDAALKAAEAWFAHIDLGGSTKPGTVEEACEEYLEWLKIEKGERGERAKMETEGYFRRLVYGDPIARVKLDKLSANDCWRLRDRLLKHNPDRSSYNRNVAPIRAALNFAQKRKKVATNEAWREALRPFSDKQLEEQCGRSRKLVLNAKERQRLIKKASNEARPFLEALRLLPMRPGEIAALLVKHFDPREGMLHIPPGKTKARDVPLSQAAVAHLKKCAKKKSPDAWLIARADGSQWKKEAWRDEVKLAAKKAKLPRAVVAYTLRHSNLTELVTSGYSLLTIAKLAGTSVRMLEKTYFHLQEEHARKALESLSGH